MVINNNMHLEVFNLTNLLGEFKEWMVINYNMHLEVFNLTNLLGECVGGDALPVAAGDHKRSEHTPKKKICCPNRDNQHGTLG